MHLVRGRQAPGLLRDIKMCFEGWRATVHAHMRFSLATCRQLDVWLKNLCSDCWDNKMQLAGALMIHMYTKVLVLCAGYTANITEAPLSAKALLPRTRASALIMFQSESAGPKPGNGKHIMIHFSMFEACC